MTARRSRRRIPLAPLPAVCALLALGAGCAALTSRERETWQEGRRLQTEGRHDEAAVRLASVLNAHRDEKDEEILRLTVDLAESYVALDRLAEADDLIRATRDADDIGDDDANRALKIRAWISLTRARKGGVTEASRRALLVDARRDFRELLRRAPDLDEASLGQGLALYETSKMLDTRTHLAHALDILRTCASLHPEDPVVLFAQARATQRLLGPATPEAMELLRKACAGDRLLRDPTAYGELFAEIAPYPNATALREKVADAERRAALDAYIQILGDAARRPGSRGEFWDRVRSHLQAYTSLGAKQARFQEGISRARAALLNPDASPLFAAQEAMRVLEEAEAEAGNDLAHFAGPAYQSARAEITKSLLSALERKIAAAIGTEALGGAEDLLRDAFAVVAKDTTPDAIAWARTFQELRERLSCRRAYAKRRDELRREIVDKASEDVQRALAELKDRFRSCTEERDFAELREELFATQSVAFHRALADADVAAKRRDAQEERRLLAQALSLTASKELAHRKAEILLLLAQSYIRAGLWEQARINLEEIPADRRTTEAKLLLATALVREKRHEEALRIFSRRELSDELDADVRWAAAAGLAFAAGGQAEKALPLLDLALNSLAVEIPFAREELQSRLRASLKSILGSADTASAAAQRAASLAEHLINSGRGDTELCAALGGSYAKARRWEKAATYLFKAKEWGADIAPATLARLRAHLDDYSPLAAGSTWEYRQADGERFVVTIERGLEGGKFAVELRAGNARESVVWERREGGRRLCRYFGKDLSRCHFLPIGLVDPSEDASLPAEEYEINGQQWKARLTSFDETVTTDAGTYEHCIVVEVTQAESLHPIRHVFAPGVGEVAVEFSGEQRSLSRTLVSFRGGTAPQAASRDLKRE